MRNLKKILALVLSLMMVLSVMVTASAADYSDADDIQYTEAVDVMSALGILAGTDGKFNPQGTLYRDQAAKIITYVALGADAADLVKGTGSEQFSDVTGGWAYDYVSYCANEGIINGYTVDGKLCFGPAGTLTGYQFGKMLLNVLGIEGTYTGSGWEVNVATALKEKGLLAGLAKDFSLKANLTREEASQLAFNAMKYSLEGTTTYRVTGSTLIFKDLTTALWAAGGDATKITVVTPEDAIINEVYDATSVPTYFNGHLGHYWEVDEEPITGFYQDDVVLNIMTGISNATYFNYYTTKTNPYFQGVELEAAPTTNGAPTVTFKLNGESKSGSAPYGIGTEDDRATGVGTGEVNGGTSVDIVSAMVAGAVVEFIDTDFNGKADVINVIKPSVYTLTADATVKAKLNAVDQVAVPGVPGMTTYSSANTVDTVIGYEGLKKGDVVLYYKSGNISFLEKCEKVTGKVTSTTAYGEVIVNGEAYSESGLASATLAGWSDFKNTYDFYLDSCGFVVKYVATTNKVASNYAVPVDVAWVTTGGVDGGSYMEARLLKVDGTTEVVKVASVNGVTPVAAGTTLANGLYYNNGSSAEQTTGSSVAAKTFYYKNGTSFTALYFGVGVTTDLTADDNKTLTSTSAPGSGAAFITLNKFYTYTVNANGSYSLKSVAAQNGLDTATITGGKANFDGNGSYNNNVGTANTTFAVKSLNAYGQPVYTVYNGIHELPNLTTAAGTVIYDVYGMASYVYINSYAAASGSNADYVIILPDIYGNLDYTTTANANGTGVAYYTVKALVNGVEKDVKLSAIEDIVDSTADADVNVLYQVTTMDDKGVVTGLTAKSMTTGVSVVSNVLNKTYTVDSDTVIYYIDVYGELTTLDYTSVVNDTTDEIFVVDTNSDGKADLVYIIEQVSTTAHVARVYYTENGVSKYVDIASDYTTGTITASGTVVITGVSVTNMGTYSIDGNTFTSSGTLNIVVTAEYGNAGTGCTVTITIS